MTSDVPPPPRDDADVPRFLAELGIPGVADVHVHFMPEPIQQAVWASFDALEDPPWPVAYRSSTESRLATLRDLGVVAHTALAYPHRAGVAAWLNEHTLGLATEHEQVVPTFTFYPEADVVDYVRDALDAGGRVAKVHLQVGKFAVTDPRLATVWSELERQGVPVVLHAGAVYGGAGGQEWCGVERVEPLVETHPDLVLVIAHAGAPDFEDFLSLAERAPSVALDTAMVFTDPALLGRYPARLLDRVEALADGVVFGSDFPTIPHAYAAQVRGVARLGFGAEWLRGLLWEWPASLLGI